ncbi:MAG TPA: hypothetical protein VH062_35405 [Polyangiaceae bacterium]|nr:hypothetical protein [Polyangiaceae bacterium]
MRTTWMAGLALAWAGCNSSHGGSGHGDAGRDSMSDSGTGGSPTANGGSATGGRRSSDGGDSNGGVRASSGGASSGGASSGGASSGGAHPQLDAGPPLPDPCIEGGTCPSGEWIDVTPRGVNLTGDLACGNYGTESMARDPARASDFYTLFMCQGVWKSSDYGQTWHGPINTGTLGSTMGDCAGGITMPPHDAGSPKLYAACIRGNGIGFWRSTNGGVDWARYTVEPGGARQDFYPPVVDPYDSNHLLMPGHEMNVLVESADGGQTWKSVATDAGMSQDGGTAEVFFIDTGDAATTRTTFLWLGQQSTRYGTWRTTNAGGSWTRVDKNEHPHGTAQIYQPDASGVVYMGGAYSDSGWGVLRSGDYGKTWTHVGGTGGEAVVFGTRKNVFAMSSGAVAPTDTADPSLELAAQPGTGTWSMPGTPTAMRIGAAQAAVANDGVHDVIVTANWGAGLWRYIDP